MRALYTVLWWLALPALPLRLWWRGRREPGYRLLRAERFGRYGTLRTHGDDVVWLHAVSLGETRAIAPLVARLLREMPGRPIVLTHMTATGREAGAALFGDRVVQAWLPYDIPFAVRGFFDRFRPSIGLIAETELWPNLVAEASRRGIPLLSINARLSEHSARGYRSIGALSRPLFAALAGVAAQSDADAQRIRDAGAQGVVTTGNVKFDIDVSDEARATGRRLRERFGAARPVIVLASTREGEETLLLDALLRAQPSLPPGTLVVLVPRHPQRFDAVAALLDARAIRYVRRSSQDAVSPEVALVLGDSLGEMLAYYAASDVAFVGGSLLPLGGQNMIEPIAVGVPTLIGPHTFNFAQASEAAVEAGAALRVRDADDVFATAARLLADSHARAQMHAAATAFIASHRGATERLWNWLVPHLAATHRSARR